MSLQQHRDVPAPDLAQSWWKLLVAGPVLTVILSVLHETWPESLAPDDDVVWLLMFSGIILATTLIAVGALLGAATLVSRRQASRRTTGP